MKTRLFLCAIFLAAFSAKAQEKFTITGKMSQVTRAAKVFLSYKTDGKSKIDSSIVTKGEFHFTGAVDLPVQAAIELKYTAPAQNGREGKRAPQDYQLFFLAAGSTRVSATDNLHTAVITGGESQEEFTRLTAQLKPYRQQSVEIATKNMELWKKSDTTGRVVLGKQQSVLSAKMLNIEDTFIRLNSNSFVSLHLLASRANYIVPARFEPLYNGLSESIKNSAAGKSLGERLDIAKKTSPGSMIFDFTQPDTKRQPFTLSSLRGKYVLIDFWASWCGPCRGETPYLKEAYQLFKDKNFEIVSISVDEKQDAWLKAIKDDEMNWINVSDLKGFQNEVAAMYAIRSIPRNFLIDPKGIILEKNLRGETLIKKLKNYLD